MQTCVIFLISHACSRSANYIVVQVYTNLILIMNSCTVLNQHHIDIYLAVYRVACPCMGIETVRVINLIMGNLDKSKFCAIKLITRTVSIPRQRQARRYIARYMSIIFV